VAVAGPHHHRQRGAGMKRCKCGMRAATCRRKPAVMQVKG
jgi:hypothetical protein